MRFEKLRRKFYIYNIKRLIAIMLNFLVKRIILIRERKRERERIYPYKPTWDIYTFIKYSFLFLYSIFNNKTTNEKNLFIRRK